MTRRHTRMVRMAVGLVVPPSDLYAIEAPALE